MTPDQRRMLRSIRDNLAELADNVNWLLSEDDTGSPQGHAERTDRPTTVTPTSLETAFEEPDAFTAPWYRRHPEMETVTLVVRVRAYVNGDRLGRTTHHQHKEHE